MNTIPKAKRVVIVGNKISPGNPATSPTARWCGRYGASSPTSSAGQGFARIAKDDEKATSPGDVLREMFVEYGPCLVLVDEWVA